MELEFETLILLPEILGAALAVKSWVWRLEHPNGEPLPGVTEYTDGKGYYNNESELVDQIQNDLSRAPRTPRVLIIGALGRCGKGAVEFCEKIGIPSDHILRWDMEETAKGGPFKEITDSDILINCIYLDQKIPKFVDMHSLAVPDRKLSVVCDVSCDTTVGGRHLFTLEVRLTLPHRIQTTQLTYIMSTQRLNTQPSP